eukprot:CAMPEP_0172167986 /NCGR_PEP_ID=MMETSP1050-20130122/9878_1 /TAXON_ID=233186 /ORGANISM="Cryptomonas curvata, Strain CCAP979/52" /LENGTH=302 /DNA_ID=CAMNT_0012838841 /DNA_START=12 /DNA_END=916 /DNA_ORIENTATION=-
MTKCLDSDCAFWQAQSSCEHDPAASSRRPYPNGSKWMMASFSALSIVGAALILFVLLVENQTPSASVTLIENRRIMTTMLSDDDGINGDINRQAKKLIQRAAQEKAHAAQENKKGADLVTKAERTCKIAEHLHNTDDGLALRARRQKEAATSLEGRASELLDEADQEEKAFEILKTHGDALISKGRLLLQRGSLKLQEASATNGTTHPKSKASDVKSGDKAEDQGGRLILSGHDILKRAEAHLNNAKFLRGHGDKTDAAAKATMALGERFEHEAVAHRLKTMTYRSKCTMMRAKAKVHLRRA